jgi:hypothetical protein
MTMRKHSLVRRSLAIVILSAWMATCGDPKTRAPLAPSGPAVLTPEITGPDTVAPGQSAQFTATIRLADGTTKLLTSVVWHSTNTSLLQVTAAGVATAGSGMGDATLQADVPSGRGSIRISREVVVVPDGTYRLVGTVKDAQFPTVSIAGARVEATPGSVATTTDSSGNFKLYGVPANTDIHVTGEGYQVLVQSVHLTGNTTRSFELTPSAERPNFTGQYTLTIDAGPGCSGQGALPDNLQHRSYQATLTQTGPTVLVTLTEPRFSLNKNGLGNHFTGTVGISSTTFAIEFFSQYYYYYYRTYSGITERLTDNTILTIGGSAVTKGTPATGLSGLMPGDLAHYDTRFPFGGYVGSCFSKSNQFSLAPR